MEKRKREARTERQARQIAEGKLHLCEPCLTTGFQVDRFRCRKCRVWNCLHETVDRNGRECICSNCMRTLVDVNAHQLGRPDFVRFDEKDGSFTCDLRDIDSWEQVCLGVAKMRDKQLWYFDKPPPLPPAEPVPPADVDSQPEAVQSAWRQAMAGHQQALRGYEDDVQTWELLMNIRGDDPLLAACSARFLIELRADYEHERFEQGTFTVFPST